MILALLLLAASSNTLLDAVRKAGDLYRQGQRPEADKATAEALAILQSRREPPDFDTAWSLNNLGALFYSKGELDRAQAFFERSRDAYLSLAGPADPRLATVLYNLAGVLVEKGGYAEAPPLYRNALQIREAALGPAHPLVAEIWNALGFLALQQRNDQDAESWFTKAVNLWEVSAGYEAFAAIALNNLARLRGLQGNYAEAESLYKRALAAEEKNFGKDHPEIATTLMSLGALYRARGNSAQAAETYRQAHLLLDRTVGARDPLTIESRARIGDSSGGYQILVVRTKQEADDLRVRIAKGEDFATLAMRHSIDPNASAGGVFRARPAELRQELRARLDPLLPGQSSAVFQLGVNWAIVRRIK
jgi:tetratricopeptide (TPR) repeat protein